MPSKLFKQIIPNYDKLKYDLLKAQTFNPNHYGFPPIYYDIMESDKKRIGAFRKAFQQCDFRDKIVCEAGVGHLALSQYYLSKVKKAYLIENNPDLVDFIKNEISKNGWTHKVELIFDDAMKVQLPEKVDFVIGELMSIFCGNEYQVQIFKHLRQFLKPNGQLLPEKIINIVQLANAEFETEKHYPINFTRHFPTQLSLQHIFNSIDLYTVEHEKINLQVPIQPILSGEVNAVYLRSFIEIIGGCNFTGSDSLMPPTVCRLEKKAVVNTGKMVYLDGELTYGTSLDDARFFIL